MSDQTKKPVRAPNQVTLAVVATIAASDDGKRRKVSGIAYTGEILSYYGSALIVDLATAKSANRVPLLIEHDRQQRAGFASLSIDDKGIQLDGELLENEHGKSVADDADGGFPWQLSINAEAERIENVVRGAVTKVNGRKVEGPAIIFRGALVREVSFTPTGVDPNTHAAVFAAAPLPEDPNMPDNDALQTEVDQLKTQVAELTTKLTATTAERESAQAALSAQKTAARVEQVKTLFAALKRAYTDDAAKPYLSMDDAAFEAISTDLKASAKVQLAANLTREIATDGSTPGANAEELSDPHVFAAAINAAQIKAAREGRTLTVIEAARLVKSQAAT